MRIIQLTPGTGSFYCGTCIRDNALVVALRRLGHDALMVPMYLPPALDETAASPDAPVLFGGVNAYLQDRFGLFRKTPRWVDRVFETAPVVKLAAGKAGMTKARDLADLTVSVLRGEDGRQVKEVERLVEWLAHEGHPEVVCLSNALLVGLAKRIKEATGAAVVCTLQGEDGFLDGFPEPDRTTAWRVLTERAADVDAFVAVSHYYARVMRERVALPAERVHVVHNGMLLDGYSPAPAPPDPPVLGFLSRMCPAKGLDRLVETFILLRKSGGKSGRLAGLKLCVAGTVIEADGPFVKQMRERLAAAGLEGEAEFLPNVERDEKIRFLQSLSALCVPVPYGESFGLYLIEALAAGVPVVMPPLGAFPELVELTGGGVISESGDAASLASAIEGLLLEPEKARAMGEVGRRAVVERFNVETMAAGVLEVFRKTAATNR